MNDHYLTLRDGTVIDLIQLESAGYRIFPILGERSNLIADYGFADDPITTGNKPAEGANPSVDHPAHYNQHPSGVECIDIVRWMGFNLGNVVKYLWRDGLKDTEVELQDLEKAAWYLNNEIQRRKNDPVYADTIIYGVDNDNSTGM